MDNTSMALLEQNIKLLEKGITLDEYAEKEMQLKFNELNKSEFARKG